MTDLLEPTMPPAEADNLSRAQGMVKSELANIQTSAVGVVTANGAAVRQSVALVIGGTHVDLQQGGALAVVARGNLTFQQGAAQLVAAQGDVQLAQGGAQIVGCAGNLDLIQGGGGLIACGGNMTVTQGGGGFMAAGGGMHITEGNGGLMLAPMVEAQALNVGVLLAGSVKGNVTAVLNTPQALALGVAAGLVGGLVFGLLSRRRAKG